VAITVTATQGGSVANGMLLRVVVLTQAAVVQNGATANTQFTATATWTQSITTTQTGSRVYGAAEPGSSGPGITPSGTTIFDQVADSTHTVTYVTFKATSLTGTPGATTLGFTLNTSDTGPFAMAEILTAGTLTEDGSGGSNSTTTAQNVSYGPFTPPAGSLLVALVASDGSTGVLTMTVSGGGLTWTEQVKNNPSGGDYAGVWVAQVAAATGGGPQYSMRTS
jgi:hypothetical protein